MNWKRKWNWLISVKILEWIDDYKNPFTDGTEDLIRWIQNMPTYFDADNQIFVHAGVDEEAGENWMWETSDDMILRTHRIRNRRK